jgi:hypothetical protein
VETLWQDIKYGFRMLVKEARVHNHRRTYTCPWRWRANTALFGLINSSFLRPMPGKDNANLMVIATHRPGEESLHLLSYPDYTDYRTRADAFSAMTIYANGLLGVAVEKIASERTEGCLRSAFSRHRRSGSEGRLYRVSDGSF